MGTIKAVLEKLIQQRNTILLYAVAALALLAVGLASYFYIQLNAVRSNPKRAAEDEAAATIRKVAALIVLPEGETPTVATVTDPERLKDQPFFSKAKVGDKVLIYANAKKAILYDPVEGKIVEVAPLSVAKPTPPPPPPARRR